MNPVSVLLAALIAAYRSAPPAGLPSGFTFPVEIATGEIARPHALLTAEDEEWLHQTSCVRFRVVMEAKWRADTEGASEASASAAVAAIEAAFTDRLNTALPAIHAGGWGFRDGHTGPQADTPAEDGWTFRREWLLTLIGP